MRRVHGELSRAVEEASSQTTRSREAITRPPHFRSYYTTDEDIYYASQQYWSARQNPQAYIDNYTNQFKNTRGQLPFSADVIFSQMDVDLNPPRSGRVVVTQGQEVIYIGAGYYNDNELFLTLFHEEHHLRLVDRARRGDRFAQALITNSTAEEFYVERLAQRYYAMYVNSNGFFQYPENIHRTLLTLYNQGALNLRNASGLEGFKEFREIVDGLK